VLTAVLVCLRDSLSPSLYPASRSLYMFLFLCRCGEPIPAVRTSGLGLGCCVTLFFCLSTSSGGTGGRGGFFGGRKRCGGAWWLLSDRGGSLGGKSPGLAADVSECDLCRSCGTFFGGLSGGFSSELRRGGGWIVSSLVDLSLLLLAQQENAPLRSTVAYSMMFDLTLELLLRLFTPLDKVEASAFGLSSVIVKFSRLSRILGGGGMMYDMISSGVSSMAGVTFWMGGSTVTLAKNSSRSWSSFKLPAKTFTIKYLARHSWSASTHLTG
jgi:hypothetical protein